MKRSLVTGAGGFIGANMVRSLLMAGHEVHAVVRPGGNRGRLEGLPISIHEVPITDEGAVKTLFEEVIPQHVFHLAASNIASGVTADARTVVETNVLGTANLLAALPENIESCIVAGSFLEYGSKPSPLKESDRCEPPELYSVTKLAATLLAQATARSKGLPIVGLRVFTPYGPFLQQGRLMYEVITKALAGQPVSLTNPSVTRDFIYVEDFTALALEASSRAGELGGRIFNAGSGETTTLEHLANLVLMETGSSSELSWGDFKNVAYDAATWQADMSSTFDTFAWRPRPLLDGIRETVAWFKSRQR